ncbi:MAG: hypothetical protein E5W40_20515, partial [Mesorhizobium sp.]
MSGRQGDLMYTAISAKLINVAAAALTGAALLFGAGTGVAHAANRAANQIVARISISQQTME